jgi:hypothetical protein
MTTGGAPSARQSSLTQVVGEADTTLRFSERIALDEAVDSEFGLHG